MIQHTLRTQYMVGDVHIYTEETDEGLILFDSGSRSDDSAAYYEKNIDLKNLKKVFITHCHVDHCGMLSYIEQNSDAEIFISKYDVPIFERSEKREIFLKSMLEDYGFPQSLIEKSLLLFDFSLMKPKRYRIIDDCPQEAHNCGFSFMRCPGHSQSDLIYYNDQYAVTGDLLLPQIVTVPLLDVDFDNMNTRFKSYEAYCRSFAEMAKLDNGRRFMPGHRYGIESVADCVVYYFSKVIDRAMRIKDRLPLESVFSIASSIVSKPESNPIMMYLKASEIIFFMDMINNPQPLLNTVKEMGLESRLQERLDMIF